MKSAVVTGANGFIGKHLVNYLLEQNVEVWAFVHKKREQDIEGKLHYVECTMDEYRSRILDYIPSVDCFFHLAWEGGIDGAALGNFALQAKNIVYSGDAVLLANRIGCKKFILMGSMCTLEAVDSIIHEKTNIRAHQVYGGVKCAVEMTCKYLAEKHGIDMNACYPRCVYGEGDRTKRIYNLLLHNLTEGKDVSLVKGEYLEDWIYVKECVRGIYAVAEKGVPGKSYYIGHRKLKLFREWVTEARDIINPNVALHFGAYGADPEVDYSLVDLDALYRDTGFEAREDFREAILNTAEWTKTLDWE